MADNLPAAAVRRDDPRRWIYVVLDALFAIGYLLAFKLFLQNRHDWAMALLYVVPAATLMMAIGTAFAARWSWWLVVVGATAMLLWTVGILILLLYTASYLSGVYGAFGKAASSGVIGAACFVVQFVALLPAFQLKWAMTRAGRRAFGLAPLWPAPASRVLTSTVKAPA